MLPLNPVYLQGAEAVLAPYHLKKFQPPKMTFHVILSHFWGGGRVEIFEVKEANTAAAPCTL